MADPGHVVCVRGVEPSRTCIARRLNSAPLDELLTLPGMTSRRAKALITAREKRGGFERISDLSTVPSLTPGYIRRIENMIDLSK